MRWYRSQLLASFHLPCREPRPPAACNGCRQSPRFAGISGPVRYGARLKAAILSSVEVSKHRGGGIQEKLKRTYLVCVLIHPNDDCDLALVHRRMIREQIHDFSDAYDRITVSQKAQRRRLFFHRLWNFPRDDRINTALCPETSPPSLLQVFLDLLNPSVSPVIRYRALALPNANLKHTIIGHQLDNFVLLASCSVVPELCDQLSVSGLFRCHMNPS